MFSAEIWQLWVYMKGRCWCISRTVYWQLSFIACKDFHQSLKPISSLKNGLNLWKRWEPSGNFQPNFFTKGTSRNAWNRVLCPTDMATPESQQLWHDGFGWMFFFRGLWSVTWQFSAQFEQHGNQMNWGSGALPYTLVPAVWTCPWSEYQLFRTLGVDSNMEWTWNHEGFVTISGPWSTWNHSKTSCWWNRMKSFQIRCIRFWVATCNPRTVSNLRCFWPFYRVRCQTLDLETEAGMVLKKREISWFYT